MCVGGFYHVCQVYLLRRISTRAASLEMQHNEPTAITDEIEIRAGKCLCFSRILGAEGVRLVFPPLFFKFVLGSLGLMHPGPVLERSTESSLIVL